MADPKIATKEPFTVKLEPGKHYWCACGRSDNQPFCDGSHEGTEFSPKEIEVKETKSFYLCGCKQTGNAPYCDETHRKL